MTIRVMHSSPSFEDEIGFRENYITMIDRLFLMRFHPRAVIMDTVGAIWTTYFLWNNYWQAALLFAAISFGLGLFFTRNIDPELMSQTTLGKIALLHKHPINLALNLIGIITLTYGLWMHHGVVILVGLSIIVSGHFFGWSEVNPKLRMT